LFEKIQGVLGLKPARNPEAQALREALEAGRRAKFAEQYDVALESLSRAVEVARTAGDPAAVAVVALHQAEVLIRLGRWADAEALLDEIEATARKLDQPVQIAYILATRGTLAQERDDWNEARSLYEQALDMARRTQSTGAEGRTLGHLGDTYLHEGNASYAAHLLRDAVPKLNASGDIELTSYFLGRLGQALIQSGQEVEGQHLLGRALQVAEQIHYRYYERYWALLMGERAVAEARYHDAYAHYTHALRLFPDGNLSPQHVATLCQLSQVSLNLRDHAQALTYAEQAIDGLEKLPPMLQAMARGTLGMALHAAQRSAEAVPYLSAAADTYSQLGGAQADRIEIETLRHLAAAQTSTDPDAALATYQRALQKAETLADPLELAQVRRDLGLLHLERQEPAAALQTWGAALAYYEASKHYSQTARLYTDMANTRRSLGQTQRAMKDYEQALMVLNSLDEQDVETRGVVLANAAIAFAEQGDVESADAFFSESVTLAERAGDTLAETVRRGNYGWFLMTIGRPRRSIAALEQALHLSQTHRLVLEQVVQRDNLGLAYDSMGDYNTGLEHHQAALDLVRSLDEPHWLASIQVNLGNTLLALGQAEGAQPFVEEALASGRARNDRETILRAMTSLARITAARGDAEAAARFADEAVALARRADHRRLLADALSGQSEQRAASGQTSEAVTAWNEAQRLYALLGMPQAKQQPGWLKDRPVQS
jgi:tetratricopeptide (TPR) repeat protein